MRTRLLAMTTLLGLAWAVPTWAQTAVSPPEQATVSPTEQVTPTGEATPPAAQAPAAQAPAAQTPAEGQVGESCRSRADCRSGLRCVQQVCRSIHEGAACQGDAQCPDQLVCLQGRCASRFSAAAAPTAAAAAAPDQPAPAGPKAVADSEIRLTGTHLIVGASLGGGMTYWKVNNLTFNDPVLGEITQDLSTTKAALMIANFHIGIMFDRLELSFEAAPVTWMPIVDTGTTSRDPVLSVLFNVGYFFHIKRDFYWPMHAGVGFVAVNTDRLGGPKFQARLQPIGIAYHIGNFLLELDVPEVRYATEFSDAHLLSLVFTFRALYMF